MSLGLPIAFLVNGGLLALGGALAAVPIIIHLLNRRRVRRIQWAAMDWLLAAIKRNQRRLRLENWLILALRCAAIILLGLALARPVFTSSALAGLFGQKRTVYLVLDTSLSTDAKTDARSVFERIKQEAELVLGSLGSDDTVTLIATNDPDEEGDTGVSAAVIQPRTVGGDGLIRAKESVATLRVRHAPADFADALRLVQEQMQPEDVNRQLVIVSDLQARDWLEPEGGATPETSGDVEGSDIERVVTLLTAIRRQGTQVQIIDVGGANRRNLAVTSVVNRTRHGAFVGRPLQLEIGIANFGEQPVEGAIVKTWVDGEPEASVPCPPLAGADRGVRVPRPGRETLRIDLSRNTFKEPGSHEIRVEIGPPSNDPGADSLGLDSERYFSITVRRKIEVLVWARNSKDVESADNVTFRVTAEQYLQGVYEGDQPGDDALDITGLASLYNYASCPSEWEFQTRLAARESKPVDLVVLANTVPSSAKAIAALRDFVKTGGGLLVFAGDAVTNAESFNSTFHPEEAEDQLCPLSMAGVQTLDPRKGDRPYLFDLSPRETAHRLVAPFTGDKEGIFFRRNPPHIWGRVLFTEPQPTDGEEGPDLSAKIDPVVLRFSDEDQHPAILAGEFGEGRTVFVATSVDHGWLDRAGFGFLPVLLQVGALHLTRPMDIGRNLQVGEGIRMTLPGAAEEIRFIVPGGTRLPPTGQVDATEMDPRTGVTCDTVGVAGMWKLTCLLPGAGTEREKRTELIAVNPEPGEGLLLGAERARVQGHFPPELEIGFHEGYAETREELKQVQEGESTKTVLWILLGLMLLESFLAMRFGRRTATTEAGA